MRTREMECVRVWGWVALMALALALFGCAASRFADDGTLVTTGTHLLPGVATTIEDVTGIPVEDVVGAAKDALKDLDLEQLASDAATGKWFGVIAAAVTALGGIVVGVITRRTYRQVKTNGNNRPPPVVPPPVEPPLHCV